MKPYADIAIIDWTDDDGNRELSDVRSVTFTNDDPSTPVKTMNRRRRAQGFTSGVATYGVELEVALDSASPEVDYERCQRTKEIVQLSYTQGDDGKRFNLIDGRVESVSTPFNAEGESRQTVKVTFLDKLPED